VLRDGRDDDVVRLLDVVESALTAAPDEHAEAELVALAEHALDMAGRRLDDLAPPAPIDLLVGWLALAGAVGQAEVHPAVTAAWIELVPTEHTDLGDPEERARAEAWRRLARAVRHYSTETFERLGGYDAAAFAISDETPLPSAFRRGLEKMREELQRLAGDAPDEAPLRSLDELAPAEYELVQRVLRDLTPRGEGGAASGALPERPRPSPPATPPVAGPGARGSAERASLRPGRASPHRVRRRRPGSPPAR
jgi:hypothetical protein